MRLLERLYQTGSALGIHVIAGSQTSEPFTEKMASNARFRWCLKTATPSDSRMLLNTDDAFSITAKGRAIVRVGDNEVYEALQPLYCDGDYLTPEEGLDRPEARMALVAADGTRTGIAEKEDSKKKQGVKEVDAVVDRICAAAEKLNVSPARKVWPDRLPKELPLEALRQTERTDALCASVALLDDPYRQTQYPMEIDFHAHGHAVVYGAPRTGKSGFLRALAFALLTRYDGAHLRIHTVGSALEAFGAFPQTGSAVRPDTEEEARLYRALLRELKLRKKERRDLPWTVLFVDDIGKRIRAEREFFTEFASDGPGCGMFLAASAGDDSEVYPIQSSLTGGYALWFSPQTYSYKTALAAGSVDSIPPKDVRGRGVTVREDRTYTFQTAVAPDDDAVRSLGGESSAGAGHDRDKTGGTEMSLSSGGTVVLGEDCGTFGEIRQDFSEGTLLILGDDAALRERFLLSAASCLAGTEIRQDLAATALRKEAPLPGDFRRIGDGADLDGYLERMGPELARRLEAMRGGERAFPPYILLIGDLKKCLSACSDLSRRRIANNLIFNGPAVSIFLATSCDSEEFLALCAGKEETALRLLAGNCAVLGRDAEKTASALGRPAGDGIPAGADEGLWLPSGFGETPRRFQIGGR